MRHGQTVSNAAGKVCGWFDAELTDAGRRQAIELRAKLLPHQFDGIWSSDLRRARETAELALGAATPDPRLREFHFGEICGQIWLELPEEVRQSIHRFHGFQAPGGEHFDQFQARLHDFVAGLTGRHILFVHAGVLRVFLQAVNNDQYLPPATVVALDWSARRQLHLWPGRFISPQG